MWVWERSVRQVCVGAGGKRVPGDSVGLAGGGGQGGGMVLEGADCCDWEQLLAIDAAAIRKHWHVHTCHTWNNTR